MVDFLGQNLEVGDFCVIIDGGWNKKALELGRICGLSGCRCRCAFIPWWIEKDHVESLYEILCSSDYLGTTYINGEVRTLHIITKDHEKVIRISPEMIRNFLDK